LEETSITVRQVKSKTERLLFLLVLIIMVLLARIDVECAMRTVVLEDIDSGTTSPTGQYRWRDVNDQLYAQSYRESYDYTQADVQVDYSTDTTALYGTLYATNLKPNFAYQLKLVGTSGTAANESIGLTGRWWQQEWTGSSWTAGGNLNKKGDGSFPNQNDIDYFDRCDINDPTSPTGKHYRYTAYLVFDYFITDSNGNATFDFKANSSYHVLWKTSQRGHTSLDGPLKTTTFEVVLPHFAYDTSYSQTSVSIFGEWERLPVGGVTLPEGIYEVSTILTEESFHGSGGPPYAGAWAAAMGGTVEFTIVECIVDFKSFARFAEHWLDSGSYLLGDFDNDEDIDYADLGEFADEWHYICPYDWPLK
jgi:hypothetical protein